ncbi:MAG: DUF4139 domain-containing protein [Bacteroidales bacterium]
MKKYLILTLILCQFFFAFSQKEQNVKSKLENVSIYLNSAQVERSASMNLPIGNSEIVITDLSQYLNANSVRISGKGAFIIQSYQTKTVYPKPVETDENVIPPAVQRKIDVLADSLEWINYEIQDKQLRNSIYQTEKAYLQKSKAISDADTLTSLRDGLSYFRNKMLEINKEIMNNNKAETKLQKQKQGIEKRLRDQQAYANSLKKTPTVNRAQTELRIQINAEKAVNNAQISFTYSTAGVSWKPYYELKVDDTSKPVELLLKAKVQQNCGEDWNNAKLTFSTGTPNVYKVLPRLSPWYLGYYMPVSRQATNISDKEVYAKTESAVYDYEATDERLQSPNASYAHSYNVQKQNLLFAEYEVGMPYTIPSDNKEVTIPLYVANLDATYSFISVPKIDKDAFLVANLLSWEKLSLIQGEANIIFQNSSVGKTRIDPSVIGDTLTVSLGVDKRVVVERKKVSDLSKNRIIGNQAERLVHMEIVVKNQHPSNIDIAIKDQIPVPHAQDIKVILEEKSKAQHNESTGELLWNLNLKPNETRVLSFRYLIKYDKNKSLIAE